MLYKYTVFFIYIYIVFSFSVYHCHYITHTYAYRHTKLCTYTRFNVVENIMVIGGENGKTFKNVWWRVFSLIVPPLQHIHWHHQKIYFQTKFANF